MKLGCYHLTVNILIILISWKPQHNYFNVVKLAIFFQQLRNIWLDRLQNNNNNNHRLKMHLILIFTLFTLPCYTFYMQLLSEHAHFSHWPVTFCSCNFYLNIHTFHIWSDKPLLISRWESCCPLCPLPLYTPLLMANQCLR